MKTTKQLEELEQMRCEAIEIQRAAATLGRLGGKVTGPSKARTSEQARAAINARWARAKKKTATNKK